MEKLRLLSLFSGIGAFEKALEKQNIPYELVNYCEIDKFASKSYAAIHGVSEKMNLGDITKVNEKELKDFDLMTWGFPCQDISVAGDQKGIIKGETRSGLYYEGLRILKEKKPMYSIIENVKNLTSKKFEREFKQILKDLSEIGYNNYWKVLNAKDYDIPQNRERVFIISIRKDIDNGLFKFPQGYDSNIRLKDVLEEDVQEKYYLSDEYLQRFKDSLNSKELQNKIPKNGVYEVIGTTVNPNAPGTNSRHWVYNPNKIISTIDATTYKQPKQILESDAELPILHNIYGGFKETEPRLFYDYSPTIRTSAGGGHIPSVCTNDENKVEKIIGHYRIRKLTPLECWRLMGFDDTDIDKCKQIGVSDTQLYKQAGNSIVVNVLEYIFKELLNKNINEDII
jgi:DNA (cytosine-5)-methyltransferase 1